MVERCECVGLWMCGVWDVCFIFRGFFWWINSILKCDPCVVQR